MDEKLKEILLIHQPMDYPYVCNCGWQNRAGTIVGSNWDQYLAHIEQLERAQPAMLRERFATWWASTNNQEFFMRQGADVQVLREIALDAYRAGFLTAQTLESLECAQPATMVSVAGWCEESIAGHIRSCEVLIDEEQRMPAPDNTLIAVLCDSIRLSRELSTRQPVAAQGTDGLPFGTSESCPRSSRKGRTAADRRETAMSQCEHGSFCKDASCRCECHVSEQNMTNPTRERENAKPKS